MADAHKNFAYSLVATAPSPATTGTSLVVTAGQGTLFPTTPFNATVWPASAQPTATNAEIVTVTNVATDTFTITRTQENSYNRTIIVGDQIAATITAKTLLDAESSIQTWTPYILQSVQSGVQTLASATNQTSSGSLLIFPVTVPQDIQFNQIVLANSMSLITSASAIRNSYYSLFGIYSMNGSTALSLISSNSFSIGETIQTSSATWNYPTSTATSGYVYGSFPDRNLTATGQLASFVTGTRAVGLQFGGNMYLNGGIYWLGVMSIRSTGNANNFGLSHAGIFGQVMSPLNILGTVSGPIPIGSAASNWSASTWNSNSTAWWGRHMANFLSATSITNQAGTAVPASIHLSAIGVTAAASMVTILPTVTFVST